MMESWSWSERTNIIIKFKQLFTCDIEYCDFVVCTFCEDASAGLFIERVLRDENFWQKSLTASALFFRKCLLPELLGKWWTSSGARLSKKECEDAAAVSGCVTTTVPARSHSPVSSAVHFAAVTRPTGSDPPFRVAVNSPVPPAHAFHFPSVRRCMFCFDNSSSLVVCVCSKCGVGYHHMCQTKDEEGRLCNQCS